MASDGNLGIKHIKVDDRTGLRGCVREQPSPVGVDLGEGCHVAGSVGLVGDRVYLGHYGNEFLCYDLALGRRFRFGLPGSGHEPGP